MGPLPPPAATTTTAKPQGPPVGRRARGTWTATLDDVQKTLHLGAMLLATQDGQNEYARHKRPGVLVPHFAGCYVTPRRSRLKPHRPDLSAPRYASMLYFRQPRAPHLTALFREQPAQASVPPQPLFGASGQPVFGASGQPGIVHQGMHTGIKTLNNQWRRTPVCRGLHGTSCIFLWKKPGRCSRDRLLTTGAESR